MNTNQKTFRLWFCVWIVFAFILGVVVGTLACAYTIIVLQAMTSYVQ